MCAPGGARQAAVRNVSNCAQTEFIDSAIHKSERLCGECTYPHGSALEKELVDWGKLTK